MKIKDSEQVFISCSSDTERKAVLFLKLFLILSDLLLGSSKYALFAELYKKQKNYKDMENVYYVDRHKYRVRLDFIKKQKILIGFDFKKLQNIIFEIVNLMK